MRVFISSVIKGFAKYRAAARDAVDYVRKTSSVHLEPIMAEKDYPALNMSSQEACMDGVNTCDIYILLLGYRYGWVNPITKLSATHEEYQAAKKAGKDMFVFVQSIKKEQAQIDFEREVSDYTQGKFRATFKNPDALRLQVQIAIEKHLSAMKSPSQSPVFGAPAATYTQIVTGSPTNVIQHVNTLEMSGTKKRK